MKYFSEQLLVSALDALAPHKTFYGITLLVAKQNRLPVGSLCRFSMDNLTRLFMTKHYKVHPDSDWFLRVFRFNSKSSWLRPDYPAKGLQSINTRSFSRAFMHKTDTDLWAWDENYLDVLESKLARGKIPMWALAVWLHRDVPFDDDATLRIVMRNVVEEYDFTGSELDRLFDSSLPINAQHPSAFQTTPVSWTVLLRDIASPPDVGPTKSGVLALLETNNVGPARTLHFVPRRRINLITGDNGLGKTFLLDACFFALTAEWPQPKQPIEPFESHAETPNIKFLLAGSNPQKPEVIQYSKKSASWVAPDSRSTLPGLVLYVKADGTAFMWDPMAYQSPAYNGFVTLTTEEVWHGKTNVCEGLIRDWVTWENTNDSLFETVRKVLRHLAPPDMRSIEPRKAVRTSRDLRPIPTISHPYGDIPITVASSGVKRVLALAYLTIWFWNEHSLRARDSQVPVEKQFVILVDEIDAHLHPKWQRQILPSFLEAMRELDSAIDVQLITSTHSPFIVSSLENIYRDELDGMFALELSRRNKVTLESTDFVVRGPIERYLSSSFGIKEARSAGAEKIMLRARHLIDTDAVNAKEVRIVHDQLEHWLAEDDPFWPEWFLFADEFLQGHD